MEAYLNVEIVVHLKSLAKQENELEKVGELPHIPDSVEHRGRSWRLEVIHRDLPQGAFARRRHLGQ